MMGLGIVVMYLGYAILYWAIEAIQGNSQDSLSSYIIPFAPKNPGVATIPIIGGGSAASAKTPAPADTKTAAKTTAPVAIVPPTVQGSHGNPG